MGIFVVVFLYFLCLSPILSQPLSEFEAVIFTVAGGKDVLHIDEWIDYHRFLGYEHFYILDTEGMYSELMDIHVDHVSLIGKSVRMEKHGLRDLYALFPKLFQESSTICTFLAVNDFVVLRNHSTIQDLASSVGSTALYTLPVYETFSTDDAFYPEAILKRTTLRSTLPTSNRYSAVLSDIVDFNDNLQPVLKNGLTYTPMNNPTEAPAVVFSASLLTRQEHRWYVEWLCSSGSNASAVVGPYDSRDYSLLCSAYRALRVKEGYTRIYSDRLSSQSEWMVWFDAYYDALRRDCLQSAVSDTAAWIAYSRLFKFGEISNVTYALYHENEAFYRELILGNPVSQDREPDDVLVSFSQGLNIANVRERKTVTLYRGSDLAMQMVHFCVDYVLHPRDCPAVAQRAINLILQREPQLVVPSSPPNAVEGAVTVPTTFEDVDVVGSPTITDVVDVERLDRILAYYQSLFHMFEPSSYEKLRRSLTDLTKIHHSDECHRGWRSGETMLMKPLPEMPSFLMYVINHDDASEQLMHHTLFGDSNSNSSSSSNGLLVPVRVRSSVFFEYIAYREVFPGRYLREWSELGYVGISTYKTVVQYGSLCTYELRRLLLAGVEKNYDVIPFVRSNHDMMVRTVLNHGRTFRYAWDSVLTALGYDESTIRRYDRIKPFYRSSMFIKPVWLMRLSQFMSRAMEVVQFNSTLYELCSVDARYEGNNDVSEKIFGGATYQLFPFIFERLAVFYLISEGAKVCQGNDDCPYNAFWC